MTSKKVRFKKIKQGCGCVFAHKTSTSSDEIIWVYVNPECEKGMHEVIISNEKTDI